MPTDEDATAPPRRRGRPRSRPGPGGPPADPRGDIVAAAGALFAAQGIDEVTMAQIAEAAGLQQSSIYYWFKSKSEVLAAILEQANLIPLSVAERELAAAGPVLDRLHRLVREDVLALCSFPFDINEIHRLAVRQPDELAGYWAERRRLDDLVEALLAEGVASGELRTVDVRLAARSILAADEATQHWFRPDRDAAGYPADQIADFVAEAAVRSLRA